MELAELVYRTTACFPKEEMFGLTAQLRRASVSVASNIAEGQGRLSAGEFGHFLGMARGSVLEVETQLELAGRLGFGASDELSKARSKAVEVARILNAAITGLRRAKHAR